MAASSQSSSNQIVVVFQGNMNVAPGTQTLPKAQLTQGIKYLFKIFEILVKLQLVFVWQGQEIHISTLTNPSNTEQRTY